MVIKLIVPFHPTDISELFWDLNLLVACEDPGM